MVVVLVYGVKNHTTFCIYIIDQLAFRIVQRVVSAEKTTSSCLVILFGPQADQKKCGFCFLILKNCFNSFLMSYSLDLIAKHQCRGNCSYWMSSFEYNAVNGTHCIHADIDGWFTYSYQLSYSLALSGKHADSFTGTVCNKWNNVQRKNFISIPNKTENDIQLSSTNTRY